MSIAKQDWDHLLLQARLKLVGASDAGIVAELYEVFTEFFNDSSSWTEVVDVQGEAEVSAYNVAPTEGQIIRLNGVWDAEGFPRAAIMPDIGVIHLQYPLNEPVVLKVNVVKNVSLPTTKEEHMPIAPDWVLPIWHIGILDGLLGKMMSQPNKSYSNQTLAVYHLRRFRDAISRARISKLRANTHGTQAWTYPQGFATRNQQGGVPSFGRGRVF